MIEKKILQAVLPGLKAQAEPNFCQPKSYTSLLKILFDSKIGTFVCLLTPGIYRFEDHFPPVQQALLVFLPRFPTLLFDYSHHLQYGGIYKVSMCCCDHFPFYVIN